MSGYRPRQRAAIYTKRNLVPATVFGAAVAAGFVVTAIAEISSVVTDAFGDLVVQSAVRGA